MATNLQIDEQVYVPASVLGIENSPYAMVRGRVTAVRNNSCSLTVAGTAYPDIGSQRVRREVATLVVRVGDLLTERATLDPLFKSVLQYLRLLVEDDCVLGLTVRTRREFDAFWAAQGAAYHYLVIVGHGVGDGDGVSFLDGTYTAKDLSATLSQHGNDTSVISLVCRTGYAKFAKTLSKAATVGNVAAPKVSVHSALASLFAQALFGGLFLDGKSFKVAFRHARELLSSSATFKLWRDGSDESS